MTKIVLPEGDTSNTLKSLIEICELVRDNSSYNRKHWRQEISASLWSSFCLQIKEAKAEQSKIRRGLRT
jgi:hypothetical protein